MADEDRAQPTESIEDILRENPELAREALERERRDRAQGDIRRPPRDDPRYGDQSVPPGQLDTPFGGTSGRGIGGSSKRTGPR